MAALESTSTLIYGIHIRESADDGSDFSNAAADYRVLFLGEDGLLHVKDSAGSINDPYTGGGGIGTDYASASTNTAQSITTGAAVAIVDFEDVAFDPGSDITTGASWKYTAPTTGIYRVSARVTLASSTAWNAATERGLLQLYLNGAAYRLLDYDNGYLTAGAGILMSLSGTALVSMSATDFIDVRLAQNSGSNITLDGGTANNYIDIHRIG